MKRRMTGAVSGYVALLSEKNASLESALAQVRTLQGLLPMCANCKNIRDDKGYWSNVEKYILDHTDARISHGLCPECIRKLYPEQAERVLNPGKEG